MSYQDQLKNFVNNSIQYLQSDMALVRMVNPQGSLVTLTFLDFLSIRRDLDQHAFLKYAVNLSDTTQPNFIDDAIPVYKFLNLGERFRFNLIESQDFSNPSLESVFEDDFKNIATQFSLKKLVLTALFQWSFKRIQDEDSRKAYLDDVNKTQFHEKLFNHFEQYRSGIVNSDDEVHDLIDDLVVAMNEAIHKLRVNVAKKLDLNIVNVAKQCNDGVLSLYIYRHLLQGIAKHYKPDQTGNLVHNINATVIKAVTDIDLADLQLSESFAKKLQQMPTNAVYEMLNTMTEYHLFSKTPEKISTIIKLLLIYQDEIKPLGVFPYTILHNFKEVFDLLIADDHSDDLLTNFAHLLHLASIRNFNKIPHVDQVDFVLNRDRYSAEKKIDFENLKLIGAWLNENLLNQLLLEWRFDLLSLNGKLLNECFKFNPDKNMLTVIDEYNQSSDSIKFSTVSTSKQIFEIGKIFSVDLSHLVDQIRSNQITVLLLRDQLKPEQLVLLSHNGCLTGNYCKVMQCHAKNGAAMKAKSLAIIHREIAKLNALHLKKQKGKLLAT